MPRSLAVEIPRPWVTVGLYASSSQPDVRYNVKLNLTNGELGCDCPAWRFHNRQCRHVADQAVVLATHPGLIEVSELPSQPAVSTGYEQWAEEHLPLR